jgi:outer membrane protein TolC
MTRFLVFAIVLSSSAPAFAERTLSLAEALSLADKQNLTLHAARTQIDRAEASVAMARAALLPVASARGKYTHNYKEFAISFPAMDPLAPPPEPVVLQEQEQLDLNAQVTVPLIVPSAYFGLSSARRNLEASRAQVDVDRATVLLSVARSFYAAAGADDLVQARKHAVEVAEVTAKNARERLKVGAVTQVETARAELKLVQAEQAEVEAEAARDAAYRALATALQIKESFRCVVPDKNPRPDAKLAKVNVDEARLRRPEIRQLERSLRAFDAKSTAAGFQWLPSLSAFGNANWFNYANFVGDSSSWAVGLQVDWTLYDGGLRDAERRENAAREREAEARLRLLSDNVADEIADTRAQVSTKARAVDAATRGVTLAQQTLKLVRAQYDAGAATQLDLLEAQDELVNSEVSAVHARFEYALAELIYQKSIGRFPE